MFSAEGFRYVLFYNFLRTCTACIRTGGMRAGHHYVTNGIGSRIFWICIDIKKKLNFDFDL